jgi:hypothetical protein
MMSELLFVDFPDATPMSTALVNWLPTIAQPFPLKWSWAITSAESNTFTVNWKVINK